MATRFELVLHGEDEARVRAAGEEALDEITRLEAALSLYRPESPLSAINRAAAAGWVRVPPEVAALIAHALALAQATGGAFDPTVAPLVEAWGLRSGVGRVPAGDELAAAREKVGAHLVEVDPAGAVRFLRPGVRLDLGAIGKGYALDRAAALLREAGVTAALLHGGTSSIVALCAPPGEAAWKVAVDAPAPPPSAGPLAVIPLCNASLSVSGVRGKGFTQDHCFFGHVLDPRDGRPVQRALQAAVVLPAAADSDALATALLVRGKEMFDLLAAASPPVRCLLAVPDEAPPGWRLCDLGRAA